MRTRPVLVVLLAVPASGALVPSAPAAAESAVRRCGTIAVPATQSRAEVSLRGTGLRCRRVQRVVRAAYERSVLLGDTRPFTVRDDRLSFRCRYTPSTGGVVCEGRGRRLRGTVVRS